MNASRQRPLVSATLVALSCIAMTAFAGGRDDDRGHHGKEPPLTVPKARCGPHDRPETGLQGQVPAALRAAGFKGFNCNLELIGQSTRRRRQLADHAVPRRAARASRIGTRAWPRTMAQARARVRLSRHGITDAEPAGPHATSACRVARHHRSAQPDAHRLAHHHVDARSVGVAEGERAAPAARGRQRPERRRRTGSRHLRHLR